MPLSDRLNHSHSKQGQVNCGGEGDEEEEKAQAGIRVPRLSFTSEQYLYRVASIK